MSEPTLYQRIGGEPAIHAAVDRFYEKVLADPDLNPFFVNVNMSRLKSHQFAFLSQAMGGPKQYSGQSMGTAHAKLAIEQRHFDLVATHLVETLRELGVTEDALTEVVAALTPLASQIVNTPTHTAVA
jgi:hemoglobin